ncbi:MAG: hypothetical protein GEU90_09645 [Gemmatimonas sp.]|nr:hypothetical protein [Gemmatimonas sp.]
MRRSRSRIFVFPVGVALAIAAGCADQGVTDPQSRFSLATAQVAGVQSVELDPAELVGGQTSTGTVTLTEFSGPGGTLVSLTSDNEAVATVPAQVAVPQGNNSTVFTVTTTPSETGDSAVISATANGVTQSAVLTVLPGNSTSLSSLSIDPPFAVGGETSTVTVTLTGGAPAEGAVVTLASSDTLVATVPPGVTVPGGDLTAEFTVTAQTVEELTPVTISASYGGVARNVNFFVDVSGPSGRQITSLTLDSTLVVGGRVIQGTVTLASADGPDTEVTLESTDTTVATVPASVVVPAGVASAPFTVMTLPVTQTEFTIIIGSTGDLSQSELLTTVPEPTGPDLIAIDFFPASVGGGGPMTGRITMEAPSADGARVVFEVSDPSVQVPSEVVVRANESIQYFPVTTSAVGSNVTVTISESACCGGLGSAIGTLTVTTDPPPPADVVEIVRARFKPGGRGGTLTVRATSTSETAILSVFRGSATSPSMVLDNLGNGRYEGSVSFSGSKPETVTVRSNLGGSDTSGVK